MYFASCIMTDEDLEYTLIICVGEFLSIPLFAVSSEMLGRIRASNILSGVLLVILISCCVCFGKIVLVIELFLTRAFSNAVLLLIYIYTPESYPTYMRSVAFGIVMLSANLAGIAAVLAVYVVGDTISWAYMWWSFIIAGTILLVTTFFYNRETVGQRLEDNRDETRSEASSRRQEPRRVEPGEIVLGESNEAFEGGRGDADEGSEENNKDSESKREEEAKQTKIVTGNEGERIDQSSLTSIHDPLSHQEKIGNE